MFLPQQRAIDPIADDMALSPYQIIAPRVDELTVPSPTLCRAFKDLLPRKPYAADDLREGLRILPRHLALSRRHIQFNRRRLFAGCCTISIAPMPISPMMTPTCLSPM